MHLTRVFVTRAKSDNFFIIPTWRPEILSRSLGGGARSTDEHSPPARITAHRLARGFPPSPNRRHPWVSLRGNVQVCWPKPRVGELRRSTSLPCGRCVRGLIYLLWPSLTPSFIACCRKAATDRFMTRAIFVTGDFAFEWARNSRLSSLDHARLVIFFGIFRVFFAILPSR